MEVEIYAPGIKLTPKIERHIKQELGNLDKFLGDLKPLASPIEVGVTTRHHQKGKIYRAEINLKLPGKLLRAEEEAENIHTAINIIKEEIERQIKKYKEKPLAEREKELEEFEEG